MVVDYNNEQKASRVFHALADSTRRDILLRTMGGEHSVSTLASFFPMSFAAVQKHVAVLERAELVTKRRQGREQLVHGDVDALHFASQLLQTFESVWQSRLEQCGDVLTDSLRNGDS